MSFKDSLVGLVGKDVVGKGGKQDVACCDGAKIVGLYFSAHWCPPCRGFTPKLAEFYNNVNSGGKVFEVIFVSSDRDQASFDEYYGEMPWLALDFSDRAKKEELGQKYGVRGIPTLILLNPDGSTNSADGRGMVMSAGSDVPDWLK